MNRLFAAFLLFGTTLHCTASTKAATQAKAGAILREGILQSVENASVRTTRDGLVLDRIQSSTPVELVFTRSEGIAIERGAESMVGAAHQARRSPRSSERQPVGVTRRSILNGPCLEDRVERRRGNGIKAWRRPRRLSECCLCHAAAV